MVDLNKQINGKFDKRVDKFYKKEGHVPKAIDKLAKSNEEFKKRVLR